MKLSILTSFLMLSTILFGQKTDSVLYGFRHLKIVYKGDPVDILIKSRAGEEQTKKPLFFFCQGSLPIPLMIRYYKDNKTTIYNVFPFANLDSLLIDFHLVIIGKPYIPLIVDENLLNNDMTYNDSSKNFPPKYIAHNLLSYYTDRNIKIIEFLRKLPYVSKSKLVVAGHSEGSTIAAKMAYSYPKITALIYSGGNPLGRMMTIVSRARTTETDSLKQVDLLFQNWKNIIASPANMDGNGDTNRGTFEFSYPPPINYLMKLRIPVLVTYGTKDYGLIQPVDYFRLETIRLAKTNFTFKDYIGVEHNFFPLKENGEINYDVYNWDKVANDWGMWLKKNQLP
ncbi:MAG: alpha/beta hydrolase [Chitinophagaceae bacterium]|nr:alpha/beta hydrolase [Chitinophagaceae bacterium]